MREDRREMTVDAITDRFQRMTHHRPWVGIVLSVLISGAGQYLAGNKLRGLCWFALFAFSTFVEILIESAPVVISPAFEWTAGGVWFVLWLLMLRDAYRPIPRLRARWWFIVVFMTVALPATGVLLITRFVRPFEMPTHSMEPTLRGNLRRPDGTVERETGDHVLVQRFAYWFSKPRRGDIMVFRTTGLKGTRGDFYIKRVVGLPSERISIKTGKLFVNGSPVNEPPILTRIQYVHAPQFDAEFLLKNEDEEFVVPENHYFVLGDNSAHSADSRYFGPVPEANIVGKVTKIYRPPDRVGVPE